MDLILNSDQKPYIKAGIFLDYIRTAFFACLTNLRDLVVFVEEGAVVLMDNSSAHVTDDMIRRITGIRVRLITFGPRTTQFFQGP
jgi:hypothetical protein